MVHIYKGSVGVDITINTKADFTNAASCEILVKLPDETMVSWTPSDITVSTTNTVVYYTTDADDLEQAGTYILQLKVYQSDGDIFFSDAFRWKIYDDYEVP
jgi:hypothetical protein